MTRVSFYRLQDQPLLLQSLLHSLINKAFARNLDVLVHTTDKQEATALHRDLEAALRLGDMMAAAAEPYAPVSLCWGDHPGDHCGILVNLTPDVPFWFSRFEQLAELVSGDEHFIASKRENYRLLRHRGYPVDYQDLTERSAQYDIFPGLNLV